jgi:C1A family cysteine protease
MPKYGLGWRPDTPDQRDHRYMPPKLAVPVKTSLIPSTSDERRTGFTPPIYDQGNLGACTGNSTCAMFQYVAKRESLPNADRVPSRLMAYYLARELEGTVAVDAGAELRDVIKAVTTTGVCFEDGDDGWPYDPAAFATKPPQRCYDAAAANRGIDYQRVDRSLDAMRTCLAEGYPFVLGFTVYQSFMSDQMMTTGRATMPLASENCDGGHAVAAWGHNDAERVFLVRNSWGAGWGPFRGYFLLPYDYLLDENLSDDFWTIRSVT